jgi:hypothetical protein
LNALPLELAAEPVVIPPKVSVREPNKAKQMNRPDTTTRTTTTSTTTSTTSKSKQAHYPKRATKLVPRRTTAEKLEIAMDIGIYF